jgi:hypothetical protein
MERVRCKTIPWPHQPDLDYGAHQRIFVQYRYTVCNKWLLSLFVKVFVMNDSVAVYGKIHRLLFIGLVSVATSATHNLRNERP